MNPKISLEDLPLADIIAYLEALPPTLPYSSLTGAPPASTSSFGLLPGRGADITAAATVTVSHEVHQVVGGGTLSRIDGGSDGAHLTLIAYATAFSIDSVHNVWANSAITTRVVPAHAAITLVYNTNDVSWYVSGVGS